MVNNVGSLSRGCATGPVTAPGKAIVSKNALKHGLLSKELLIPGESSKVLAKMKQGLNVAICPEGALEGLLVDRIVASWWRLRRIMRIEKEMMGRVSAVNFGSREADLGEKFMADCTSSNAYLKLMRYENSIQRGLYRAMHELVRLQMMRHGAPVPAPMTIAVDLSSEIAAG